MPIYKRMIYILTTGIMLIGMLTFTTGHPVRSAVVIKPTANSQEDPDTTPVPTTVVETESTPTPTPEPTATAVPTPDADAPNPLLEEIYPDIHDLIQSYYDAKANVDLDTIKTLVTNPMYISTETITAESEYIQGYSDLRCFTKRGGGEIDFVVYCTFNMIVPTIQTPIASLESFCISYKDGKPLIFTGLFDEETQLLLDKLDNDDDVNELKRYTTEQLLQAAEADPSLSDFLHKLYNIVGEDDQEASSDTETTN